MSGSEKRTILRTLRIEVESTATIEETEVEEAVRTWARNVIIYMKRNARVRVELPCDSRASRTSSWPE